MSPCSQRVPATDYLVAIKATVVSSILLEKPHSLCLRPLARSHFARLTFASLMLACAAMSGGCRGPLSRRHQRHRRVQHAVGEAPLIVPPAARSFALRSLNIRFAHIRDRKSVV